jgi:hypothetical protein
MISKSEYPESFQLLSEILNSSTLFPNHSIGKISAEQIQTMIRESSTDYIAQKRQKVNAGIAALKNTEIDALTESQIAKLQERLLSLINDQEKLSDTQQYIGWLEFKLSIMEYEVQWQARQKEIAKCMHRMSEDLIQILTEDVKILTDILIQTHKTNTQK